ncbi:DUF892 family protein [Pararhizobium sp. PWRC1-1]|uniref:DUF892 family protein n=1 Tax=Pararhizobium sp. PWRC1-1 TaxID=2804566 RepID=UPI003CF473BC
MELGFEEVAEVLQSTLDEEQVTDLALTAIARSAVNQKPQVDEAQRAPIEEVGQIR